MPCETGARTARLTASCKFLQIPCNFWGIFLFSHSSGFGGFDDTPGDMGGGAAPAKPNVWGAPTTMGGIVIPPFVPRDQRNAKVWDVGKVIPPRHKTTPPRPGERE